MKNKQTAMYDFLVHIRKMKNQLMSDYQNGNASYYMVRIFDTLEAQAFSRLEMEKEQMFEFAERVLKNTECSFTGLPFMTTGYDNIYEETYGK